MMRLLLVAWTVVGTAALLMKSTVAFAPSAKLTAAARPISRLPQQSPFSTTTTTTSTSNSVLWLAEKSEAATEKNKLPFWLDPGTKGGAVVLTVVLFVVPLLVYQFVTNVFGFDEIVAGKWIGIGFTVVAMLGWVSTYIFRVATKDMTYAKQLKDYENAVIAKRMEELDEDEIQALVEEVERDEF